MAPFPGHSYLLTLWIKLFKPLKTITWLIFLQDWGVIVSYIPEWESEYDVGCK